MFWPLSTTAAARLATPFLTCILACIFLREFATKGQLSYITLVLLSAMLIVLNTPPRTDSEQAKIASLGAASFLAYVYLFGEPLGMAVG